MKDYRKPEHRKEYFTALYDLNLRQGIMPGLVYLYLPALAKRFGWDAEQKLWFCFLNGLTQNPISSLILFSWMDYLPQPGKRLTEFRSWFNKEWRNLLFDTDRKYQKKDTVEAIELYANIVDDHGSQKKMLTGKTYQELWAIASQFKSFGRLSTFSYLEYVHLSGFGADCDDLMFDDRAGSRSHRNGMFFLIGNDHLVDDKRQPRPHPGNHAEYIYDHIKESADTFLDEFRKTHKKTPNVSRFTMESNLCTFKNHFFGHRYPGVYADMAWDRIQKANERGHQGIASIFAEIREEKLPRWLRMECDSNTTPTLKQRGKQFQKTGFPYRGERFL